MLRINNQNYKILLVDLQYETNGVPFNYIYFLKVINVFMHFTYLFLLIYFLNMWSSLKKYCKTLLYLS